MKCPMESLHFGQLCLGNLFLWLSPLFVCALQIVSVTCVALQSLKKRPHSYFLNNSVKNEPISTILVYKIVTKFDVKNYKVVSRHNVECTHRAQLLPRLSRWPIAHPSTNNGVDTNVWTGKTRMGELHRMTAFKLSWLMGGIPPL